MDKPERKLPVRRAAYIMADEQRIRAARMMMFNQWIADAIDRG